MPRKIFPTPFTRRLEEAREAKSRPHQSNPIPSHPIHLTARTLIDAKTSRASQIRFFVIGPNETLTLDVFVFGTPTS